MNFGAKVKDVSCSPKQYMVVQSANYGDFNKNGVFHDDKNVNTECSALVSCQVKSRCGGKRSCALTMNNDLLPLGYNIVLIPRSIFTPSILVGMPII